MNSHAPFRKLPLASAVATTVAAMLLSSAAYAGAIGPERASSVDDPVVEDLGGGIEQYTYTVNNDSDFGYEFDLAFAVQDPGPGFGDGPLIVDWELPYFNDAGIDPGSITSPDGWTWAIEDVGAANPERGWGGIAAWQQAGDPFYEFLTNALDGSNDKLPAEFAQIFLDADQVLHWYIAPDFWDASDCNGTVESNNSQFGCSWGWESTDDEVPTFPGLAAAIQPSESLGGFSFQAPASLPVAAPYQASWFDLPVRTGDPPFPGGPLGFALPTSAILPQSDVPEPASLALAGLGVAGLAAVRRRRRR